MASINLIGYELLSKGSIMVGMRTFKTALAVGLCMLLYNVLLPNSLYLGPFYGSIAAVISIQPTTSKTKHIATNRVIGTMIGGLYSAILYSLYIKLGISSIDFLFVFVGVIITIITCNKFGFSSGISTGCIVLIGAFALDFPTSPLLHALYRTIDTSVGVIIAYLVNKYLPGAND